MSRTSLAAATATLSLALIVPAVPAGAAGTVTGTSPAQVAGQTQTAAVEAQTDHRRRHWRGFRIAGRIEDKAGSPRRILVDQRRGPDRVIRVKSYTRIYRDGDRVGFRKLREGDRVLIKGVKKDGRRYAVKIWAAG